jgi:ABC-type transporter Mla subunit MlaD
VQGRGADINAFFGQLPGFTEKWNDLFATLDAQQAATTKAISSTGEVFDAISEREGQLRGLVTDSDQLFATTAVRNRQLAQIFQKLPRFERESSATLPVLTAFGEKAQPVVQQLQPAATAMKPAFAELDDLAPQFDGFFGQLQDVVKASKAGLPAFDRILGNLPPLLDRFQPFLRNANPMVDYIGNNKHEVTSFFANVAAASQARDLNDTLPHSHGANVHYLRTSQGLTPESLTFYPRPLASTRTNSWRSSRSAATAVPSHARRASPRATTQACRRCSRSCTPSSERRSARSVDIAARVWWYSTGRRVRVWTDATPCSCSPPVERGHHIGAWGAIRSRTAGGGHHRGACPTPEGRLPSVRCHAPGCRRWLRR